MGASNLFCAPENGIELFLAVAPTVGAGVAVYPNSLRIAGLSLLVTEANGTVLEPTTKSELPSAMGVPKKVIGESPR